MKYECTTCGRPVELDATGEFARDHRKPTNRKFWCDGSGRAKEFLRKIEGQ